MLLDLISRSPYVVYIVLVLVLDLMALIALVAIGAIVAIQWRKHRQNELEYSLKREMLNRGMSADDIERVFRAGRDHADQSHFPFPWMPFPWMRWMARRWCC